jgi:hypothetical protein
MTGSADLDRAEELLTSIRCHTAATASSTPATPPVTRRAAHHPVHVGEASVLAAAPPALL